MLPEAFYANMGIRILNFAPLLLVSGFGKCFGVGVTRCRFVYFRRFK